jgi:hypothetical protein
MPNLMSTVIDGHDVLAANDHILGHHDSHRNDADIHDLSIPPAHFHNSIGASIPVSINGSHNVYYNSYADTSFQDIGPYPYPLQPGHVPDAAQLDLQYILSSDMSHSHSNDFIHDHSQLQTKHFQQSQDLSSLGPPSDPESQPQSSPSISSSASFAHALHDLSRSPDNSPTPYTPSSPLKVARYAHAMLPPIVHSSPSSARKDETDVRSSTF